MFDENWTYYNCYGIVGNSRIEFLKAKMDSWRCAMAMQGKFSDAEVVALRSDLFMRRLDNLQTAEMIKMFIMGRGYGS